MDEIAALRAQFHALQNADAPQKLSERNCIEIILKLINLKLVDIIYTVDGKSYVTPRQLELEIEDEIMRSGGRLNVIDLQPVLNVDESHIQSKVASVIKRNKTYEMENGEVIASYYLDKIVEEINETLQAVGKLNLSRLGARFDLGSIFLENAIRMRMGRKIRGQIDNDVLYTEAYADRMKRSIRGAMCAATSPVDISTVANTHEVPLDIATSVVKELVESGEIDGIIKRGAFIPSIFILARDAYANSFYSSNGYITYNLLSKFDVTNPREHATKTFTDGIPLTACFCANHVIDRVDDAVDDCLTNGQHIDVLSLLPPVVEMKDLKSVLEMLPSLKKPNFGLVLADQHVVSKAFLDRCVALIENFINDEVAKNPPKAPPKQEGPAKLAVDDNDEGPQSKTKSQKSKKGGKSRGKRNDDDNDGDDAPVKKKDASSKSDMDELIKNITKWFPQCDEELVDALAVHFRSLLGDLREKAKRAAFQQTSTQRRDQHHSLQDQLTTVHGNLLLFMKGLDGLNPAEEDRVIIEKHILKTIATDLANNMLNDLGEQNCVKKSGDRASITSELPEPQAKAIDKMFLALGKQSVNDFLDCMITVAEFCQLKPLRKLDKKQETQILETHEADLTAQLTNETKPAMAFHQAVLILYLKKKKAIVHAPPRSIALLVNALKENLPPAEHSFLKEFQANTVQYLIAKVNKDKEKLNELLVEGLPKLKDIALKTEEK